MGKIRKVNTEAGDTVGPTSLTAEECASVCNSVDTTEPITKQGARAEGRSDGDAVARVSDADEES